MLSLCGYNGCAFYSAIKGKESISALVFWIRRTTDLKLNNIRLNTMLPAERSSAETVPLHLNKSIIEYLKATVTLLKVMMC